MKRLLWIVICGLLPITLLANPTDSIIRKAPEVMVTGVVLNNYSFKPIKADFQGLCDVKVVKLDFVDGLPTLEKEAVKIGDTIRKLWYNHTDFDDTLKAGQTYTFFLSIEQYGLKSDTSYSFLGNNVLIAQNIPAVFEKYKTTYIKRGKKVITKRYYTSNNRIFSKAKQIDRMGPRSVTIYSIWNEKGKLISKQKVISVTGYAGSKPKIVWDFVKNGKRCFKRSVIHTGN